MFPTMMHLMLSAVRRYTVGLVYQNKSNIDKELVFLKGMLTGKFSV